MKHQSHLLIVDDVVDNIQVAMSILKENNYEFSFATNGQEGLELIRSTPKKYDLILLDIMMPIMNGYDVCKALKEDETTRHIPIIFLTAKVDIDSISRGFSLGAVDYLTKPFHAEELLARVKNQLDLYHAKRILEEHNISLENKVEYARKRFIQELESSQHEMIYLLTELMEATSDETGRHIRRIAETSALLAKLHPALTEEDEEILRYASPMHDIGKMTIPHEILHKPARYTESEYRIMQAHTTNAYNLLKKSSRRLAKAAAIIAHQHHEKWDGTGYPQKLQGNNIHIYGRVVSLADVFDALTHKRCYKDAWTPDDALSYIQSKKGTQFDPELVDLFTENFDQFKAICETNE